MMNMPICFIYVHENLNTHEVFMDFLELERITGEHIGNCLLKFCTEIGRCYDGVMTELQTCGLKINGQVILF